MALSFSQISSKRAAIRQPGYGIETMPGAKTFSQLMSQTSGNAVATQPTNEPLPSNNIYTIDQVNLTRINGTNLTTIS